MNLLGGLNWLDLVFIGLVFASLAIGFVIGLVRPVLSLAAMYIAAILGAQYFGLVSATIKAVTFQKSVSRFTDAIAFYIILLVVTVVLSWLAHDVYGSTKLKVFPLLDRMGGSIVCLLMMIIATALVVPVARFAVLDPWVGNEPIRFFFLEAFKSSNWIALFDSLTPIILDALKPWLPQGMPAIFDF